MKESAFLCASVRLKCSYRWSEVRVFYVGGFSPLMIAVKSIYGACKEKSRLLLVLPSWEETVPRHGRRSGERWSPLSPQRSETQVILKWFQVVGWIQHLVNLRQVPLIRFWTFKFARIIWIQITSSFLCNVKSVHRFYLRINSERWLFCGFFKNPFDQLRRETAKDDAW